MKAWLVVVSLFAVGLVAAQPVVVMDSGVNVADVHAALGHIDVSYLAHDSVIYVHDYPSFRDGADLCGYAWFESHSIEIYNCGQHDYVWFLAHETGHLFAQDKGENVKTYAENQRNEALADKYAEEMII